MVAAGLARTHVDTRATPEGGASSSATEDPNLPEIPPHEWPTTPVTIGVDVARFGDAQTVIAIRKGDTLVSFESFSKQDTMYTVGRIVVAIREHEPDGIYIDEVGVGGGVLDRVKEMKFKRVRGVNVGHKSNDPEKYLNLRAEDFDYMRELFESERIRIPNDRELIAQLTSIRYSFTSMGQMKVEDKDSLRRQGLASPDKADALMLAFAAHKLSNNYKIWV